jgi:hypothetical protein
MLALLGTGREDGIEAPDGAVRRPRSTSSSKGIRLEIQANVIGYPQASEGSFVHRAPVQDPALIISLT